MQQVCRGPRAHVGVQLGVPHVLPSLWQRQPAALPSRMLHQLISPGFLRPSGEEEAKVTVCHHTRPCVGTPTAGGQLGAAFLVHSGSPGGFCGLRDSTGTPRPSLCFPGPAGRSEPRPLARRLGPHCTVSPSQHPCTSPQPDEGLPAQGTLVVARSVTLEERQFFREPEARPAPAAHRSFLQMPHSCSLPPQACAHMSPCQTPFQGPSRKTAERVGEGPSARPFRP